MTIKPYEESKKMQFFRLLFTRLDPNEEQKQYFDSMKKGEDGERIFSELLSKTNHDNLILHDLLLEQNNNAFQIDALLIAQKSLHIYEIKNFKGDYYIEAGKWYTQSGTEIQNPIFQLRRAVILLQQFLRKHGFNLQIKGSIIFINPEFTLYQASRDLPIILPTQINRFLRQLKEFKPGKIDFTLAKKLITSHIEENFSDKIPEYDYDQLKKGIDCNTCHSFKTIVQNNSVFCQNCGNIMKVDLAIVRCVQQFQLLFPDKKVTVNAIENWCAKMVSHKTIRRILAKNYILRGYGKSAHYIERTTT